MSGGRLFLDLVIAPYASSEREQSLRRRLR
jgi:hypothetical protein